VKLNAVGKNAVNLIDKPEVQVNQENRGEKSEKSAVTKRASPTKPVRTREILRLANSGVGRIKVIFVTM
jgi:hypothetical protein